MSKNEDIALSVIQKFSPGFRFDPQTLTLVLDHWTTDETPEGFIPAGLYDSYMPCGLWATNKRLVYVSFRYTIVGLMNPLSSLKSSLEQVSEKGLKALSRRPYDPGKLKLSINQITDYPYSKIVSVSYQPIERRGKGLLATYRNGSVTIEMPGEKTTYQVDSFNDIHLREFADLVKSKMKLVSQQYTTPASPDEFLVNMERLGQLKHQGLLSDDEFEAAKAKLLGT